MPSENSYGGPWVIRMWSDDGRKAEPMPAKTVADVEQILGGIFGAISLLGPGENFHFSIEASD